jgi:hypothetical protein
MPLSDFVNRELLDWLQRWLKERLPVLNFYFIEAIEEFGELESEYAVFSHVVRPYLEHLAVNGSSKELTYVWDLLEQIAGECDHEIVNELHVMMEELELCHHYNYLGPLLRKHWFLAITWFPRKRDRTTGMNEHVDINLYERRWREEITKIGGFERLDSANETRIKAKLWQEFNIERPIIQKNI